MISALAVDKLATVKLPILGIATPDNDPPVICALPELKSVAVNVVADPLIPVTDPLVIAAVPLWVPVNVVVLMVLVFGLNVNPDVTYAAELPVVLLSVNSK